jgi:phosphoglycerol transferase MdoB-like AlkP superfamily enzyme
LNLIPQQYRFFLKIFSYGIVGFTIFRLLLVFSEFEKIEQLPDGESSSLLLGAFWMGLRFDIVISGYLLILPFVLISIMPILKQWTKTFSLIISIIVIILYSSAFLVSAADIPYFNQFFTRFNASAFQWADTPDFVFSMVFQEISYWWVFIPHILISTGFAYFVLLSRRKLIDSTREQRFGKNILNNALAFILLGLLLFVGIRGRLEIKSPIRIGTAYFSNYAFPNQLGLNPVFTLMESYFNSQKNENKQLQLINDKKAIENVRRSLGISDTSNSSPIARDFIPDSVSGNRANVVIIIMESMAAVKMGRYGNPDQLTPFLDRLAEQSLTFDNCYTAGIHTHNGIYSTLFSFPALKSKHTMNSVDMPVIDGIASTLARYGYESIYVTTHDDQFDNVGGFLSNNGFGRIVAQKDYPADEVKTALGVPDDVMLKHSISYLNEITEQGKPFLAAMMTASDHGPYYIPDYFTAKSKDIRKGIVEYADWSLSEFIKLAKQQTWFDNTIFVFVTDHGAAIDPVYSLPLNYHHTPMIFYSPMLINAESRSELIGQIDIFPTIMELLALPYSNNTFGIEQLSQDREYIYFCADNKCGVLSDKYYLIIDENGEYLYDYMSRSTENIIESNQEIAEKMKEYLYSNMQAAQFVLANKLSQNKKK